MLQLVFGRSGYGKTEYIRNRIADKIDRGETQVLLITPEQYSFISEYSLLEQLGEARAHAVRCLSFSRLCDECDRLYGADGRKPLTKGGKAILMKTAIDQVRPDLELFEKKGSSAAFVQSMTGIYDEMKSCNLSGAAVYAAADDLDTDILRCKMRDFSRIMTAYEALLGDRFADPANRLTRLYDQIKDQNYFAGQTVFLDGFNGFVAQEYKILERIIAEAKAVYIALDSDSFGTGDGYDLFAYVNETAGILQRIADKAGVPTNTLQLGENCRTDYADLRRVEQYIFADQAPETEIPAEHIRLYAASTVTDACNDLALQIKGLLRCGYRAGEIAVTMRDREKYAPVLASAFEKYGVPYYADERQPVTAQPILVFPMYLMRSVIYGWRSDDLFSLIKTGLTDVSDSPDLHRTENYVYTWGINGAAWKRPFDKSPKGFSGALSDSDRVQLERINALRQSLMEPLVAFQKKVHGATPRQISTALFEAIKAYHADKHLQQLAAGLAQDGASALAEEQGRTWDVLMRILDQLATVLPEKPMALKDYCALYALVTHTEDLGEIPMGLDNVQVGQADRMRFNNPRALFILGANEGEFPQTVTSGGLLSDNERKQLAAHDFKLYSFGEILNLQERYFAYKAVSAPRERLFVTYTATGRADAPSAIVTGIQALFPNLHVEKWNPANGLDLVDTPQNAFELMSGLYDSTDPFFVALRTYFSDEPQYAAVQALAENRTPMIKDTATARKLFGKDMVLSASRIEDYYNCPYRYFCKFGLGAQPRQKAEINPMERGTLIHYVLEKLLSEVGTKQLPDYDRKQITALVDGYIEQYFKEEMGDPSDMPSRFRYNFRRLPKMLVDVVCRLAGEFAESDFEAKAFELPIDVDGAVHSKVIPLQDGGSLRIRGSVDRVDVLEQDGQQFVRVVDYKSGAKPFRLADIVNGLNLQMFLYLFNVCADGSNPYAGVPAGVLYMHAARSVMTVETKSSAEKDIAGQEDKAFGMNGIVITNPDCDIPAAMEHDLAGKYIPVRLKKSGVGGSLASLEQLGLLQRKIEALVADMGNALQNGQIGQHPVQAKDHDKTCEYCDFASVCAFKKSVTPRTYDDQTDSAVLAELEKEGESHA